MEPIDRTQSSHFLEEGRGNTQQEIPKEENSILLPKTQQNEDLFDKKESPLKKKNPIEKPIFDHHSLKASQLEKKEKIEDCFLPCFNSQDRCLYQLHSNGICDLNGNLNHHDFPSITWSADSSHVEDFLTQTRNLLIDFSREEKDKYEVVRHFFNLRDCLSLFPQSVKELVGTEALRTLGIKSLKEILFVYFPQIKSYLDAWLNREHVTRRLSGPTKDIDIRMTTHGDMTVQKEESAKLIRFFESAIIQYPTIYKEKLESIKRLPSEPKNIFYEAIYEFAIPKKAIIEEGKTQYIIHSVMTQSADKKQLTSIDFLFVSSLKQLNLSSKNSLTLALNKRWFDKTIQLNAPGFGVLKSLIDLLLDVATIKTPSVDAWLRTMRDCDRSYQKKEEAIEQKMVENVIAYKNELENKKSRKWNKDVYLFELLKKEVYKSRPLTIGQLCRSQELPSLDGHFTIPFLFRVCQSLSFSSYFSDDDFYRLWLKAEKAHWWPSLDVSHPIACLKKTLVDEKIPFRVVSACLSLILWIREPKTATNHHESPVFHLKKPFQCLMPIAPLDQMKVLMEYFHQHHDSIALAAFYQSMSPFLEESPLIHYFKPLKINPEMYQQGVEDLLRHPTSFFLNQMGFELFLNNPVQRQNSSLERFILSNLPRYLENYSSEFQKKCFELLSKRFPAFASIFTQISNQELSLNHWSDLLVESTDERTFIILYQMCGEGMFFTENAYRRLFYHLSAIHPVQAMSISKHVKMSSDNQMREVARRLLQAFRTNEATALIPNLNRLYQWILPLVQHFSDEFQSEKERNKHALEYEFFITTLTGEPSISIEKLLLILGNKNLINQPKLSQLWLDILQKTIELSPIKAMESYLEAKKEGQILAQEENSEKRIHFWNTFLNHSEKDSIKECYFNLLGACWKEDKDVIIHEKFKKWFISEIEHLEKHPFVKEFLLLALQIVDKSNQLIIHTMIVNSLYRAFEQENLDCSFFDELFTSDGMKSLYLFNRKKWSELLMNYLERVPSTFEEERSLKLWELLFQAQNLNIALTVDPLNDEKFVKTACSLFIHSAQEIDWMRRNHQRLLSTLKLHSPSTLLPFIRTLGGKQIYPSIFIWKHCFKNIEEKQNLENLVELIQSIPFDKWKEMLASFDKKEAESSLQSLISNFSKFDNFNKEPWEKFLINLMAKPAPSPGKEKQIKNKEGKKSEIPEQKKVEITKENKVETLKILSAEEQWEDWTSKLNASNKKNLGSSQDFTLFMLSALKKNPLEIPRVQKLVRLASEIKLKHGKGVINWLMDDHKNLLNCKLFENLIHGRSVKEIDALFSEWASYFYRSEKSLKLAMTLTLAQIKNNLKDPSLDRFLFKMFENSSKNAGPKFKVADYCKFILDVMGEFPNGKVIAQKPFEAFVTTKFASNRPPSQTDDERFDLFELLVDHYPCENKIQGLGVDISSRYDKILLESKFTKYEINNIKIILKSIFKMGLFETFSTLLKKEYIKNFLQIELALLDVLKKSTPILLKRVIPVLMFIETFKESNEKNKFECHKKILNEILSLKEEDVIIELLNTLIKNSFNKNITNLEKNHSYLEKLWKIYYISLKKYLEKMLKSDSKNYHIIGSCIEIYLFLLEEKNRQVIVEEEEEIEGSSEDENELDCYFPLHQHLSFLLSSIQNLYLIAKETELDSSKGSFSRTPSFLAEHWLEILSKVNQRTYNIAEETYQKLYYQWLNFLFETELSVLQLDYFHASMKIVKNCEELSFLFDNASELSTLNEKLNQKENLEIVCSVNNVNFHLLKTVIQKWSSTEDFVKLNLEKKIVILEILTAKILIFTMEKLIDDSECQQLYANVLLTLKIILEKEEQWPSPYSKQWELITNLFEIGQQQNCYNESSRVYYEWFKQQMII